MKSEVKLLLHPDTEAAGPSPVTSDTRGRGSQGGATVLRSAPSGTGVGGVGGVSGSPDASTSGPGKSEEERPGVGKLAVLVDAEKDYSVVLSDKELKDEKDKKYNKFKEYVKEHPYTPEADRAKGKVAEIDADTKVLEATAENGVYKYDPADKIKKTDDENAKLDLFGEKILEAILEDVNPVYKPFKLADGAWAEGDALANLKTYTLDELNKVVRSRGQLPVVEDVTNHFYAVGKEFGLTNEAFYKFAEVYVATAPVGVEFGKFVSQLVDKFVYLPLIVIYELIKNGAELYTDENYLIDFKETVKFDDAKKIAVVEKVQLFELNPMAVEAIKKEADTELKAQLDKEIEEVTAVVDNTENVSVLLLTRDRLTDELLPKYSHLVQTDEKYKEIKKAIDDAVAKVNEKVLAAKK